MNSVFLYVLHSGNLYGTERMALATLMGLRDQFSPILFAPPGPAIEEAGRLGIEAIPFSSSKELALALRPWLARYHRIAFAATGVSHSLIFLAWNLLYRRRCVHIHLVHGGADERLSYGRKRILNGRNVTFVAVSDYVRSRLVANGVHERQVRVCENFLPDAQIDSTPRRASFQNHGLNKVIIVSRVDPIKRISLLLDALDRHPELASLSFTVYGTGWDLDVLRERAAQTHPNVQFAGFSDRIPDAMQASDLLLHTCPVEPFGLAILEAMAAGVPVLVPDEGGASTLVEPGASGFHFKADDPDALAEALQRINGLPAETLNRIVAGASARLRGHYSESAGIECYRNLFAGLDHGQV
jgi:glycosyltransferase involved in cell wall biosynthesis